MPQVDTFSIVVGTESCNARCPFCVARMTSNEGVDKKPQPIHIRNFLKSCLYAERLGVHTVMLTSKGEPTLFPDLVEQYLELLDNRFPIVELQTNATLLDRCDLERWYDLGLTTIAISISHYDPEENRKIYLPHKDAYVDLAAITQKLHEVGYTVRFACVMSKGLIDSWVQVKELIDFTKQCGAEQLTIRPVNRPNTERDLEVLSWVDEHRLSDVPLHEIADRLEFEARRLLRFSYGATVYDYKGQNICLTNSLTVDHEKDQIRQIIYFPDGHLRYDWTYPGAIIF